MAHESSFEDRAVGRFNNLADEGFNQAAVGLWMDLLQRASMAAPRDAGTTLSASPLAKLDQGTAPSSAAARKISAQLLAATRKDDPVSLELLRAIAARCADDLDERLELGASREDLPALVEVMRDLFGCDQILREAGVISEDDEPNAD
jgi:hypothetical protein